MLTSTRRRFLERTAGLGIVTAGALWQRTAAAEPEAGLPILVVVELTGGNDGLNTVVPFADDRYARARPTLRLDPKQVLKLDDHVGLHPALKDFKTLYDAGHLTVVQGVGYPDPNRSHTRSMEIWQTGVVGPAPMAGWLGRVTDADPRLTACHVGPDPVPLAVRARKHMVSSVADLAEYRLAPGASLPNGPPRAVDDLTAEIQQRIDAARDRAAKVAEFARNSAVRNPNSDPLRARLDTIRTLIELDPALRVFYTAQSGYDTHANQEYPHQDLLRKASSAVAGFLAALRAKKLDERVLVLLFSEFGRRVAENAQRGTDHGTAGPVFLAGTPARGGLIGPPPDLADLDDGDLKYAIDFRDVYATLLRDWLDVDPVPILGDRATLPLLGR